MFVFTVSWVACLTANGTAIKGGCVTRRTHRADPGSSAAKRSRCQEGMARVFAVQVIFSWAIRVSWHKLQGVCEIVMLNRIYLRSKAQYRGTICHGAKDLSWLQELIASGARIRAPLPLLICLGSRNLFAKTVTSQLTFIDRVS